MNEDHDAPVSVILPDSLDPNIEDVIRPDNVLDFEDLDQQRGEAVNQVDAKGVSTDIAGNSVPSNTNEVSKDAEPQMVSPANRSD